MIVHGTLAGIIAISVIHLAERGRRRAQYAEHTFGAHDRSLRSPHAHRCVVASVFPLDPSESSHIDFRARVVRRRDIARRDASPFAVVVATRPGIVATLTPSPPVPLLQDGLRFPRHALPCRRRALRASAARRASPRASPPRASRCARRTTLPRGLPSTSSSTCASARCSRRPSTRTPTSSTSRRSTSARRSPARSAPVSHPTWQPRSVPDPSPVAHRSLKRRNF